MEELRRYCFPRVRRVKMHAFSLYTLRPDAVVAFEQGVLCLAGANGIGKSTFLAAVNYGMTGAVPHPERPFLSTSKYLREARAFAREFFDGRILESDRETAAVTIDFTIGEKEYSICRGLLDSSDVRVFSVNGQSVSTDPEFEYRRLVPEAIGLASFEQFVFMQHFIFTFDEARHLLFWDQQATAQTMYLCFGGNPEEAAIADHLNREMERAASRGRNYQFQATNIKKRMDFLKESLSTGAAQAASEELEERYRELRAAREAAVNTSSAIEARLEASELKLARLSAQANAHRESYNASFDQVFGGHAKSATHPLIAAALNEATCEICQTSSEQVREAVRTKLDRGVCPLCQTPLASPAHVDPALMTALAEADALLHRTQGELENATAEHSRLKKEAQDAKVAAANAISAVSEFENVNAKSIEVLKGREIAAEGPVHQTLKAMEEAYRDTLADREREYAQRDVHKDKLKLLQRQLETRYAVAEERFLPLFRRLAKLFLGIDLDVKLITGSGTGMKLSLSMRGETRETEYELSESQKFFIDIALRMAFAQLVSLPSGAAQLFIDTPEGSLDIAYEDRAGEMFSEFVKSGHDIIMTANINTSALLTTLARNCGSEFMTLTRMTGWTELSDVQAAASHLFEGAFDGIEAALQQSAG